MTKKITQSIEKYAYGVVKRAIVNGLLIRPDECSKCKKTPLKGSDGRATIHAHHEDHSKPLDVNWLCAKCHMEITYRPTGENHHKCKLKDYQVLEIKESNLSSKKLAKIYNVDFSTILKIKRNKIRNKTNFKTKAYEEGK